jgi:hypothetical protein
MTGAVLSARALGRATLARQLLLARAPMGTGAAVEHLVGLQAQAPDAPYVALWSRLSGFDPASLGTLLTGRQVVRTWLMRTTIHLAGAADALSIGPVLRRVHEVNLRGHVARHLAGIDAADLAAAGADLLREAPRTRAELGRLLAPRWPEHDPDSLALAITYLLPLVQVPPRGIWRRTGPVATTTLDTWLGDLTVPPMPVDRLVLRYLAAFGPASVRDAQVWSGLTRLREVFDRLAPDLPCFRDEHGVDLYDLPDAPRPEADTPAPVRFLPEYDNLLLSHADRTRVLPAGRRVPLPAGNGGTTGTFLVDGTMYGTWRLHRTPTAHIEITPDAPIPRRHQAALEGETASLLVFLTF